MRIVTRGYVVFNRKHGIQHWSGREGSLFAGRTGTLFETRKDASDAIERSVAHWFSRIGKRTPFQASDYTIRIVKPLKSGAL